MRRIMMPALIFAVTLGFAVSTSSADPWKDESGKYRENAKEWEKERREALREREKELREAAREWEKDRREALREWQKQEHEEWLRQQEIARDRADWRFTQRYYSGRPDRYYEYYDAPEYYGDEYYDDYGHYEMLPPPAPYYQYRSYYRGGPLPPPAAPQYGYYSYPPPAYPNQHPAPASYYYPESYGRSAQVGANIGSQIGGLLGGSEGAAVGASVGAQIGAEVDRDRWERER